MVIIYILVVAIFLWLVFNHPFKDNDVDDTYEYFLDKQEKKKRRMR